MRNHKGLFDMFDLIPDAAHIEFAVHFAHASAGNRRRGVGCFGIAQVGT